MSDGTVNYQKIPAELQHLNQWVCHKAKQPKQINGKSASSTDENSWASFEDVCEEYVLTNSFDGIGFVFTEESGYVGVDLDNALKPDGTLKTWALKILTLCESYCEISPSGKGLHIICKGVKPGPKCKRQIKNKKGAKIGEVEVYDKGRYFTMTGHIFNGLNTVKACDVKALYDRIWPEPKKETKESNDCTSSPPPKVSQSLTDIDIIEVIAASSQGSRFNALLGGDISTYGDDISRAVFALTSIVAWYTDKYSVLDSLMRDSGLFVDKWAKGKWDRLGRTQFDSVRAGFEAAGNVYTPGGKDLAADEFDVIVKGKCADGEESKKTKGLQEYERHIDLLHSVFVSVKRDIMTGELHVLRRDGTWVSAFSESILQKLKSKCYQLGKDYKATRVKDYLGDYQDTLEPELLVEVDRWDGVDRIEEMCRMMNVKAPLTVGCFTDIFKEWCGLMWNRIHNPETTQNLCVIISGAQGIGKDVWVDSMFWSMRHYVSSIAIEGKNTNIKKLLEACNGLAVAFISEFDKLQEIDPGSLKELITTTRFKTDFKYERAQKYLSRTSFLGACNNASSLRDVTGNRRFMIFDLEGGPGKAISWKYPKYNETYSRQILAQVRELGIGEYKACPEHKSLVADRIEAYTEDNPIDEMLADTHGRLLSISQFSTKKLWLAGEDDFRDMVGRLAKDYGMRGTEVKRHLKANGFWVKHRSGRYYGLPEYVKIAGSILSPETDDSPFD